MHPHGTWLAHRVAYALAVGEPEHDVCHTCDTPPCIEPSHLFDGTPTANIKDAVAKGRMWAPPIRKRCMRGHWFTEANSYRPATAWGKQCKKCKILRQRISRSRAGQSTS